MLLLLSSLLFLQGIAATPLSSKAQREPLADLAKRGEYRVTYKTPEAVSAAALLVETSHYATLEKTAGHSKSSRFLRDALGKSKSALLYPEAFESEYAVEVTYGTDTVKLILDTGSSDTWLAQKGFVCVDYELEEFPESDCDFGPLYDGTFADGKIKDVNFNISYGDGEFLTGIMGYEDVTLAGVKVIDQETALVDYCYWNGDNVTSGLIGLAYASLTSAFKGTVPADDTNATQVEYTPFIGSAIKQKLISPMFSLALERGANGAADGGYIALGGLPPVTFDHTFSSAPIEILQLQSELPDDTATQFSFYTIQPDGFILGDAVREASEIDAIYPFQPTTFPMVVDSGTTLIYLPAHLAKEINSLFDPPSRYIEDEGVYENYCAGVKAPDFAVRIAGTDYYINGKDLILNSKGNKDPYTGGCITGIQDGGTGPFILGDVFLKNVVAVFDVGASEMRFASHKDY